MILRACSGQSESAHARGLFFDWRDPDIVTLFSTMLDVVVIIIYTVESRYLEVQGTL